MTIIEGGNQVNSIPSQAQMEGNIRMIPEINNAKTEQIFCTIIRRLNQRRGIQLEIT
ncbi:peptidase dimerization domain-containing protein [Paenilisteria rocourtiae]|uniref:peptidase dimerization domain-containing protein n=1 Tax=Listeria rocourtiae TaxID=647910 RepID=UPI0034D9603C